MNFLLEVGGCCDFHSALSYLRTTLRKLQTRGCNKDFRPLGDWQCRLCGVLGVKVDVCEVCGGASGTPASHTSAVHAIPQVRDVSGTLGAIPEQRETQASLADDCEGAE